MSKLHTILTAPKSAEQIERQKKEAHDYGRYKDLLEVLYKGYVAGDIKSLDNLCQWLVDISKEFEGVEKHNGEQVLPKIPQKVCERSIGEIIMRAVLVRPLDIKQNTVPVSLRKLICGLVKVAKEKDGYVLGVEAKGGFFTAFDKISDLMKKLGVQVEASTVRKYYQEYK